MTLLSTELRPHTRATPLQRFALPGLLALLMAGGLAFRAAPLLNRDGRLLRQFPTEDGYLMLTIARNIAIGKGMSTADGTIPTNGTQPAVTFLWAVAYRLVGGDKVLGVALVQVVQIVFGLLAAYALYRLGRLLLAPRTDGPSVAALAAALWYAAPLTVQHGMNCLETGAYVAVVLATLWALMAIWQSAGACWRLWHCLALGALLGLCFWIRNDAVFLIAAVCLVRASSGIGDRRRLVYRFRESAIIGATTLCAALPWLIYNKVCFGHIMPISGVSEAMAGRFAGNLVAIPSKLAEYILVVGAIPGPLERHGLLIAGCLAIITVFAAWIVRLWRRSLEPGRAMLAAVAVFALLLVCFYGLYFGAGHFMSRYLFPLSPLAALLTLAALDDLRRALPGARLGILATAGLAAAGLCVLLTLDTRTYLHGRTHMHFQVVDWVSRHVPEQAWVAAPQTGTLGYFHDRTINLDGKVNPEALRARMSPGIPNGIPQYIVDKNIDYIVDWAGMAGWMDLPVIQQHFQIAWLDPGDGPNGLGALKRLPPPHTATQHIAKPGITR